MLAIMAGERTWKRPGPNVRTGAPVRLGAVLFDEDDARGDRIAGVDRPELDGAGRVISVDNPTLEAAEAAAGIEHLRGSRRLLASDVGAGGVSLVQLEADPEVH